jgi:hypothetical protein
LSKFSESVNQYASSTFGAGPDKGSATETSLDKRPVKPAQHNRAGGFGHSAGRP